MERAGERRRVTIITHEDVLADPTLWTWYRDEKVEDIKSGRSTWMLDELPHDIGSANPTISLSYYLRGKKVGYVIGNTKDHYQVYGPPIDPEEDDKFHHINTEPVEAIGLAQQKLMNEIKPPVV